MTETELEKKWENTVWDIDAYLDDIDGEDSLTNEEWFTRLSTEEKAKFLKKIIKSCGWCLDGGNPPYCLFSGNKCLFNDGDFVEWLKQPHREE